jgi:hypothetical protein
LRLFLEPLKAFPIQALKAQGCYVDIVEVTDSSSVVPIQLRIQEDIDISLDPSFLLNQY